MFLVVLAWIGTFFYWHVRITWAMSRWESEASIRRGFNVYWRQDGAPPEAYRILEQAGCRALPYFIRRMGSEGTPSFKSCIVSRTIQFLAGPGPREDPEVVRRLLERYFTWDYNEGDTPTDWKGRQEAVLRWWQVHGAHRHQWWRIWSASCPRFDCSVCER